MKARPHVAISNALAGRLVIVCGPGGVGKTTLSAALALVAAGRGRKTLVCTIDPSKRLRTSLGLARLTGAPQKVRGRLFAMRLDPKQTFDDLVRRHAQSPEARERVLSNRFYQQISRHLAGTHEVMAMEALMEVADDFDLIVLDTPPAASALAFLDAPKRVLDFVDGRVLRYFLKPYFVAGRLTVEPRTLVGRTLLRILDSAVGLQFLRELSEFFLAFEGLFDSFRKTAHAMEALLRVDDTAFILVTSPSSSRVSEGASFALALRERSLRAGAIVVNRVHPWAIAEAKGAPPSGPFDGNTRLSPAMFAELSALAGREQARADADARHLKQIALKSGIPAIAIPELESDVHDLKSLALVGAWLCPAEGAS
ncbi:MAG: ArsA family ATPase [Vicinamibacteria bacterium]|nr:ArsA family ATPase [Vicinamibacteria bacterium]